MGIVVAHLLNQVVVPELLVKLHYVPELVIKPRPVKVLLGSNELRRNTCTSQVEI